MAKVQKAILTEYTNDGSVVMSNIRKGKADLPVIGSNETYSATLVTEWYDGSPMDDSKADGAVYLKYKGTEHPNYTGSYFRVNLPNFGELFLEKDTVDELRAMSNTEILLLKMGYYKGVTLNGYYEKGDTPAPIDYYLSYTEEEDDGGSIFEVGRIKLKHEFKDSINTLYFGLSDLISLTPSEKFTIIQNTFTISNRNNVPTTIISKGVHIVDSGLTFNNSNCKLVFEGSLKLKDYDSTPEALTGCRLVGYVGYNIHVINQKLDGNRDFQAHNPQIGTQFNFTCYTYNDLGGIYFTGGWSINAIQSHCQFVASEVKFRDYKMMNSGEHGIYYSLAVGGSAGKLLQLDNVEIVDNGIATGGSCISARAVKRGIYNNCVFDNGASLKGGQVSLASIYYSYRGAYPSNDEDFLHKFYNCQLIASSGAIYTVGARVDVEDTNTVDDYTTQGKGIVVEGGKSNYLTGEGVLVAQSHMFEFPIGNKSSYRQLPLEIINSSITNLYKFEPLNMKNLSISNCVITNTDSAFRDVFSSNLATGAGVYNWVFLNNTFKGFTGLNIIRSSNPSTNFPINVTGNYYVDCEGAVIAYTGSNPEVVINNNVVLDTSSVTYRVDATVVPKSIEGNSFVVKEGSIAQRPAGFLRYVGMRFFNTSDANYQIWVGDGWINTSSPNATTSVKGLVNQAVASSDTATAPSETYTQAEVQAILTELRDLKAKLRTAGILAT